MVAIKSSAYITLSFRQKNLLISTLFLLALLNIAIALDLPILRELLGFFFLWIFLGLLIKSSLGICNRFSEDILISIGISISSLLFIGMLINNLYLAFGHQDPLHKYPLIATLDMVLLGLIFINYYLDRAIILVPLPHIFPIEKFFLILSLFIPISFFYSSYLLLIAEDTRPILFCFIFLSLFIILVSIKHTDIQPALLQIFLFLISISLLSIAAIRFTHIWGQDVQYEYYNFQTTLINLHWQVIRRDLLDACLSISLLPTIFQSIMSANNDEYLFKYITLSICAFTPLSVYLIANRYVGNHYAFLSSFFYLTQSLILFTVANPRTSIAIFFISLAILILFNENYSPLIKKLLFIIFIFSITISHYSSTYIFFIILTLSLVSVSLTLRANVDERKINITVLLLFFVFIFLWYSLITEGAFNTTISFLGNVFLDLNKFFLEESRAPQIVNLYGKDLAVPLLSSLFLIVTWATFALIAIGSVFIFMNSINSGFKNLFKFNHKFEAEYIALIFSCMILLIIIVVVPNLSKGYSLDRLYMLALLVLSVSLIAGCIAIQDLISNCLIEINGAFRAKLIYNLATFIFLMVVIPYFLFQSGALYELSGISSGSLLNKSSNGFDMLYISDSESSSAKWLSIHHENNLCYSDEYGAVRLVSQGHIIPESNSNYIQCYGGYLYLCNINIKRNILEIENRIINTTDYLEELIYEGNIYDSGRSRNYFI